MWFNSAAFALLEVLKANLFHLRITVKSPSVWSFRLSTPLEAKVISMHSFSHYNLEA